VRKLIVLSLALISLASARVTKPVEKPVVRRWLSSLTLKQKVAQLVVIPFYGEAPNTRSKQYRHFLRLVQEERVGGLILVNRTEGHGIKRAEPYALAAFLNRMQRMARIPLLVGGDFERGASMRVDGMTLFPHAMAFAAGGDPQATKYMGEITARDSRALGVHWIFFPVADVNSKPPASLRTRARVHPRRADRPQESHPHHGQTLSRARRHGRRYPSEAGLDPVRPGAPGERGAGPFSGGH
jgi:hypothetical protein